MDLSESVAEEATKYAHALGMDFHAFMTAALEEKLAELRTDEQLRRRAESAEWKLLLKE